MPRVFNIKIICFMHIMYLYVFPCLRRILELVMLRMECLSDFYGIILFLFLLNWFILLSPSTVMYYCLIVWNNKKLCVLRVKQCFIHYLIGSHYMQFFSGYVACTIFFLKCNPFHNSTPNCDARLNNTIDEHLIYSSSPHTYIPRFV